MSSPRTWGCFFYTAMFYMCWWVFPTNVGVFLQGLFLLNVLNSLPHERGGVSQGVKDPPWYLWSSPRTWGCFYIGIPQVYFFLVFPTNVGVFLRRQSPSTRQIRLPHERGGVSLPSLFFLLRRQSSPRTWGCFCDAALSVYR